MLLFFALSIKSSTLLCLSGSYRSGSSTGMQMPACLYGLPNASRTFGGTSCAVFYALMTVRVPVGKLTSNAAYDNAVAL